MEEKKCECEMTREELVCKLAMMEAEIAELEATNEEQRLRNRYKEGMIDGLKFAIRANGVSGAEV